MLVDAKKLYYANSFNVSTFLHIIHIFIFFAWYFRDEKIAFAVCFLYFTWKSTNLPWLMLIDFKKKISLFYSRMLETFPVVYYFQLLSIKMKFVTKRFGNTMWNMAFDRFEFCLGSFFYPSPLTCGIRNTQN